MHPFVHGDEAVAVVFRRDRRRPASDYGFDAAQHLALEVWHRWVSPCHDMLAHPLFR
jgi:hypothetical protein